MSVAPTLQFTQRDPSGANPRVNMTGQADPALETSVVVGHRREIFDARGGELTLEREGFKLVEHDTRVADFDAVDEVRATYYREMEELALRHTGAEKAVLFDHTIRKVEKPTTAEGEVRTGGVAPRGARSHDTRCE